MDITVIRQRQLHKATFVNHAVWCLYPNQPQGITSGPSKSSIIPLSDRIMYNTVIRQRQLCKATFVGHVIPLPDRGNYIMYLLCKAWIMPLPDRGNYIKHHCGSCLRPLPDRGKYMKQLWLIVYNTVTRTSQRQLYKAPLWVMFKTFTRQRQIHEAA